MTDGRAMPLPVRRYIRAVDYCNRRIGRAAAFGARLQTGTVLMNRVDYLDPALCWSERKNTGRGGALSVFGYHNLTRTKSYHLKKTITQEKV